MNKTNMINKYQEGGYMSEFAPVPAYQPDYKFLVSALQVQENEYQRGLSTVRNVYSSLLNKDVTSSDNQTYRNEIFKKLQTSLKDISAIDFSNPVNISRAQSLLEPITNDQQLMYDMQVSQFHKGEKQRLESVRNSTDEKVRSTYNPISLQAINLVEDELRNAKRGENSITNIRPQKFVAFQDPIKDLDALAKESNLEIEIDNTDGKSGYIVKTTNGAMTIPQFTNWAKARLGAKYDEQFAQEAFVKTESQIRNVMQQQNISKQQATKLVATELSQNLYNQTLEELQASDATLKKINEEIDTFEDNHPDGGKTPKLKQQYQNLLAEREKATNELALKSGIDEKFKNEGIEYISQNLNSIVSNSLKSNAAKSWASTYAMAKMKHELRPDQVVLEKWKLAQDERQHQQDLAFKQQQAANENAWKQKNYELEVAKMNQATAIAQAEGKLPSTNKIDTYTGDGTKATGVDILSESLNKNRDEIFNLTFGANNGLINAITGVGGKNFNSFSPTINKIKQIAATGQGALSETDKTQLVLLASKLGLDPYALKGIDGNAAYAQGLLNTLIGATYTKALEHVSYNVKQGKVDKVAGMADVFNSTIAAMNSLLTQRDNLNSNYKRLAQEIAPGGQIKSMYQGVKVMYNLSDGTPVFDVTGLEASKKAHLENIIDAGWRKRSGAIGTTYQMNVLSDAEVTLLTKPGFATEVEVDEDDKSNFTVDKLNNLSIESKRKLFSNGVLASFDPGSSTAVFEIKIDPSSSIAKELGIKATKTLKLKTSYGTLSTPAIQESMPRVKELIAKNQQDVTSAGNLEPLLTNFTNRVDASNWYTSYGFDYSVVGVYDTNGKAGLNVQLDFINPQTNKKETKVSFFSIADPNNPGNYKIANDFIDKSFRVYQDQLDRYHKEPQPITRSSVSF